MDPTDTKKEKIEAGKTINDRTEFEHGPTGTVVRQPVKATLTTKEKERAELNALEIAEQKEWEVKTLPVWEPGNMILNTYEVADVISGGMGHVYIANHNKWNVKLAIKSPNEMMLSDKNFYARILREANAWVEMGMHPNIAYCYHVRNIEDVPHIVVEYVDGGNLRQWIEDGKCIDYRVNLDLAIQFCHSMEFAHSKGMIHRDIKPENVLMTKDGTLKITDFGLVRGQEPEAGIGDQVSAIRRDEEGRKPEDGNLTAIGTQMGTAGYISPEQYANPHDVDERTDIFAFGVCLYEMFCGNRPYEITFGKKQKPPNPLTLSGDEKFPMELAEVLRRSVQWDASDRYSNFNDIRAELTQVYKDIYGEESPYARLEHISPEADGLNNRGVSFLELGKPKDASMCFNEALNIFPYHLESVYNNELLLWRQGQRTDVEAVTRLESLHDFAEDKARHQLLLAQLLMERGDAKCAVVALRKALNVQPAAEEFWEKLGNAYLYLSDFEKATKSIKRALSLSPENLSAQSLLRELDSSKCVPQGYAGYCWEQVDLAGTYASGKEPLAFHVNSQQILVKICNKDDLAVAGIFDSSARSKITGKDAGQIFNAAFAVDGKSVVLVGDESVKVWSLKKNKLIRSIKIQNLWTLDITTPPILSPDGTILIARMRSGENNPTVYACPPDNSEFIPLCIEPGDNIVAIDIDYTGRQILTASRDGTCRVWSLNTGLGRSFYHNPKGMIFAAYSQNSGKLITCSRDSLTTIWKKNETKAWEIVTHPGYPVAASLHDRLSIIAILNVIRIAGNGGENSGHVQIWDMNSRRCLRTLNGLNLSYDSKLEFNQEHNKLFIYSSKGGIRAWQVPTRFHEAAYEICRVQTPYEVVSAAKKAERLILEAKEDLKNKKNWKAYGLLRSAQEDPDYLFDSRIVDMLKTLHKKGKRRAIRNSRCLWTIEVEHKAPVSTLLLFNDTTAISGTSYGGLQIWNLKNAICLGKLMGHSDPISTIVPSASGKIVVTLDKKNNMRTWDIKRMVCISNFDFSNYQDVFQHLTLNTSGTRAFSTDGKKHVIIWDLEIEEMDDHFDLETDKEIHRAVFSEDDDNVVCLDVEKSSLVRVDLQSRKCVAVKKLSPLIDIFQKQIFKAEIMNDAILLRERKTGKELCTLRGHEERVMSLDISMDGRHVISGDEGGTIRLWEMDWELEFD